MDMLNRARAALTARLRKPVGKAARRAVRSLPAPVRTRVRTFLGTAPAAPSRGAPIPDDPLGLSAASGSVAATTRRSGSGPGTMAAAAGRGAAATGQDPDSAHRLDRALHGGHAPRPEGGGRSVAVLAAADLTRALASAGHRTEHLLPGTARAQVERAEAAVLDLAGLTGVWDGALDADGVGLYRELIEAVGHARDLGITVWLVDRGAGRTRLGGAALRGHPSVRPVRPGAPAPGHHVTEDPGDAPSGIVDLLRCLDPLSGTAGTPTTDRAQEESA